MKTTITIFAFIFICLINIQNGYTQRSSSEMPTYVLDVANMTLNSPDDNAIEFDIYIRRTSECPLFYLMGRYEFFFNPLIANGGNLTYSFVPGYSQLPYFFRPANASVQGNRLLMQYNNFFSAAGSDLDITNSFPGTRICRMRLETSASSFDLEHLSLRWNNPGNGGVAPVTRIYAFVGFSMSQITSPETHSIDSTGINGGPLPVELSGFNAAVNNNFVTLNWTTSNELNNSGFDIERKSANGEWSKIGFVNGNGTSTAPVTYMFNDKFLSTGKYNYRLKQIDFNGTYEYHNLVNEINIGVPEKYSLSQNYPNPFNPTTTINYEIPADGIVSLKLYDISGKEIKNLINEFKPAGYYSLQINAGDLPSGTYLYRLSAAGNQDFSSTKKMILTK